MAKSIAQNLPRGLPGLINVPIAENRATSTQIASGVTYGFSNSSAASDFPHHYSFCGGNWEWYNATKRQPVSFHFGNGSDPSASGASTAGGIVRFATWANKFEVLVQNYLGFRIKVNGKYLQDGMYGVAALNGDASGFDRWFLFDFTGTEFAGTGLKQIELSSTITRFGGVRVPAGYTVEPWPQAVPIRAALCGDSMPSTFSDSADSRTARHGNMGEILKTLTGIPDLWITSLGGCGFISDSSGTRSTFLEQATYDLSEKNYDVVWEIGGRNDAPYYGSEASYRALVEQWIEIYLADNPDTLIFMTGPLSVTSTEAAGTAMQTMQRAKKAAAAKYPQNCAFIETCGNSVTADPWIFGSGRVGATAGDGNADLVRGTDGVHPSVFGHQYLAHRIATETARVIPLLASRIRNGVIPMVNDDDLT
ncbi:hypothetical protein H0274_11175 [Altererythrobacter sp. CC-YST694]|uniref:hypothetical protein n=1 Tax=Altererythrobacter sp. CC-YST694 TaxID=2755038 RepID=UPI001D030C54|nr:hypothetical protein [Altererythrobacter sp. CC-YST694]MCB5425823.1 hypothetical protein [Altererythrobacter sp. CC-YST694]